MEWIDLEVPDATSALGIEKWGGGLGRGATKGVPVTRR